MSSGTKLTLRVGIACCLAACGEAKPAVELGKAETPSTMTDVGRAPAYAVSSDGAEAVVWVSAPDGGSHGRLQLLRNGKTLEIGDSLGAIEAHDEAPPKIAFGQDSLSMYVLYVVAREEAGRRFPASALRFIKSHDAGASWSSPVTVTDDSEFGSHNFHGMHVARDGSVYVSWLDGRHGGSHVYVARSPDGGKNWETNRRVFEGEACPCCRTTMSSDSKGTLFLSWRTVMPGNIRDIVVSRSSDRGATWSEPTRVHADNWVFPGCPHAGPALQVDEKDRLHVAWWTGLTGKAGVYYAHSNDAAKSWSTPIAMGVADFSRPASVQLALGRDNKVFVAWCDGTIEIPEVVLRTSNDGGGSFADRVSVSEPGRHAFFPVIGVRDSTLTILWSEQSAHHANEEAAAHPDMSKPDAVKGLSKVGQTQIVMRRGVIR